jgi:hypothetical protein
VGPLLLYPLRIREGLFPEPVFIHPHTPPVPGRRQAGLFSELPRRVLLGNSSLRWGCSRSGLFFYFLLVVLVAQAASRQSHQ